MRTTVNLDDDVHEVALGRARATGRPLGRVLSDLARPALQAEPHSPANRAGPGRFTTFDVPCNAGVIPASRIREALDADR